MKTKLLVFLFTLSLILIFAGSFMGRYYHTSKGAVDIKEISFITSEGGMLRSLLYIPKDIKTGEKRPAVVGAHGYNNTAELQGLNAIELSSRGIVVLTVDQYGHGKSGFPSESVNNGISADGGIYEAMQYLKNLPFVDLNKVGLVGHSMGGTNIQYATEKALLNHRYLEFKPQEALIITIPTTPEIETITEEIVVDEEDVVNVKTPAPTSTTPTTSIAPIAKPAPKKSEDIKADNGAKNDTLYKWDEATQSYTSESNIHDTNIKPSDEEYPTTAPVITPVTIPVTIPDAVKATPLQSDTTQTSKTTQTSTIKANSVNKSDNLKVQATESSLTDQPIAEVAEEKIVEIVDNNAATGATIKESAGATLDKTVDDAIEGTEKAVEKAEQVIKTTEKSVESTVEKASEKLANEAEDVSDKISDEVAEVRSDIEDKAEKIMDNIVEEEEEEEELVFINNSIDRTQIVVPIAILPTSQSFVTANTTPINQRKAGYNDLLKLYDEYAINIGIVFGQFDEWAKPMWGVDKGSLVNTTEKASALMGFTLPEYDKLYRYGSKIELSKKDAIRAAQDGRLRVIYQPKTVHPRIHMSKVAATNITEFFHITLLNGKDVKGYDKQLWFKKEIGTGVALAGYFLFIMTAGLVLLRTRFFSTIIREEPISPSNPHKFRQYKVYFLIYLGCLIPAPLFYNLVTGYPIDIKSAGRTVKTLFPANDLFPMPTANGLVLFNLIIGAIMLLVFVLTYKRYMKKNGVTFANLGVALNIIDIAKAFILAALVFLSGYVLLAMVEFLFQVDFRFYVFSIKTLTTPKLCMFAAYLPFWLFMFLINSLTLNSFTRMEGRSEVVNVLLMMFANVGGLLLLWLLDYGFLMKTGVKLFKTVPYPLGTTSALAGVLLWGLLFILPISAVISRIYFKATGSIWLGGFINAMVITLFAISNTVIAAGIL